MPKLFTIGPVNIDRDVLKLGAEPPPYFRDESFAALLMQVQQGLLRLAGAPDDSSVAVLTASGTAALESAIINFFDETSRVLVIEGGTFGQRLAKICEAHQIPHQVLSVDPGRAFNQEALKRIDLETFGGILVCAHETSTGQRFDIAKLGELCRMKGCLLLVDAISSILADPLNMANMDVDVAVFSSNKGLAVAPGLAFVIATPAALAQLKTPRSYYLDLARYFANSQRGQTPFTSACGTIVMLHAQLLKIERRGGASAVIRSVAKLAEDFRSKALDAGFQQFPEAPSNAASAIVLPNGVATPLYVAIRDKHNWFINPPSHEFEKDIIRIGHLGDLSEDDNTALVVVMVEEMDRLVDNWRKG
ncbi:MAG: alanine--glyoxylate aminotransferase family protein [Alphaproteobacteria bacterium]|nr:alanine--glyoxylate aminotransferase family protein [Alphaproteobacteria bacterium]